jgi:hypothetical protein
VTGGAAAAPADKNPANIKINPVLRMVPPKGLKLDNNGEAVS